ncbi:hypothetical protein KY321_00485 [Candidatus Woesearchaeota archaeon]|nr:hypothetical protein [Candidatus Woesearchaeota archaeon]
MKFKSKDNKKEVVVVYDEDSESPRAWDNLSTMAIKSSRYNLSDNLDFTIPNDVTFEEFEEYLIEEQGAVITIPLWIYDHSGISLNTSKVCRWDSSPVGYAFVTKETLRKEYNVKNVTQKILEKARAVIKSEIETYNQYLMGQVYAVRVNEIKICDLGHEHKELIESISGFYDVDDIWDNISENKEDFSEVSE